MSEYTLIKPEQNCGMCGYIWQTIRAIHQNPNEKYYIDFTNSIYKTNNDNVWNYFFYQPHSIRMPETNEIKKQVGIIFDQQSEFIYDLTIPKTEEEIKRRRLEFNNIINKYIKLKPHIQYKIDTFVKNNFENKKILGVHFRGTDHPNKKNMDQYMQIVKEKLVNYDKLFVCSDEHERYILPKAVFRDKVIGYKSLRSGDNDIPLHASQNDPRYKRPNDFQYQYKIAEDVIIESYLMSKVNFLICAPSSNVNFLARAINSNLEYLDL